MSALLFSSNSKEALVYLGHDDNLVPWQVELLDSLAENALGLAV